MKRIISLVLTLIMALGLISCGGGGEKGKTYTGVYGGEDTKLVINGNYATLSTEYSEELSLEGGIKVKATNIGIMTGVITSNENGVVAISFSVNGATATMQIKLSGSGADTYRETYLDRISQLEDGPMKNAQLTLISGKTLKMAYGDELWDTMGPGNNRVITLNIDEENGTFTEVEEG